MSTFLLTLFAVFWVICMLISYFMMLWTYSKVRPQLTEKQGKSFIVFSLLAVPLTAPLVATLLLVEFFKDYKHDWRE